MRVAYADPPYFGCCGLYRHEHGIDGECWDNLYTHRQLILRLVSEYPDGWALSLSTPSLWHILPMCPDDVRVASWVKPFAVFKPNVNPAYAWEPVIWRGGRTKRKRDEPTVRDWVSAEITLKKGLTGAKPETFCWWLFELLGLQAGDELVDLYPGTGGVTRTWRQYQRQRSLFGSGESESLPAVLG
jgi:hypothetical protein